MQILTLIENNNGNINKVKEELNIQIKDIEKYLKEMQNFTEPQFREWLAKEGGIFAVASKEYYISNYNKAIKRLKSELEGLDYWVSILTFKSKDFNKKQCQWIIKDQFKGKLRQLKRVHKLLLNKGQKVLKNK